MTTRRRLMSFHAVALATFGVCQIARADLPLFTLDLRVHGTNAKEAIVSQPGDTVTLDLFIRANGQDSNPNNDGMQNLFSSFMSGQGGLVGDLIGLPPPFPFNQFASQPGRQNDLDDDGDMDIGSLASTSPDYYFSRGGPIPHFNQPEAGFLIASIRFTALGLNDETTQVRWIPRDSNDGGLSVSGVVDGIGRAVNGASSLVDPGLPVTIRAASVGGGGTVELLSGTINSHLLVDHTFRQGPGNPVVLANGVSVVPGGLFDMRNAQGAFAGQEIRVNDLISANQGGAVFVDQMTIGGASPGQFAQQAGLTQIGSGLVIGGHAGNSGTLLVTGGTMRAGVLSVGAANDGHVQMNGGILTVDDLDMTGSTASSTTAQLTGGVFEVTSSGTLGNAAGATNAQLLVNGGQLNSAARIYMNRNASGAPSMTVTSGNVNFYETFLAGGARIDQSGGNVGGSWVRVGALGGADVETPALYSLSNGTFAPGALSVGEAGIRGTLRQTGGVLRSRGITSIYDKYELLDGQASLWAMYIETLPGGTPALVDQSGGYLNTDYLVVRGGTYHITGGTFEVNKELRIEQGGTIDFGNGLGALAAGQNSLIEMPTQGIANASSARLVGKPGSLINYQPGHDPRTQFGNVQIDGLLHEQGTPLHIPSNKSVTGAGDIVGNVMNDGELNPGYAGGRLDITGTYSQSNDAKISFELGGYDESLRDVLSVSGAATLDGTLEISLIDNYRPLSSDIFTIITASSITGRFDNANSQVFFPGGRFDILYSGNLVWLRNFAPVPEPSVAVVALGAVLLTARRRART